jgi:hypothetical protein
MESEKAEIVHAPNPYDQPQEVTPMSLLQTAVSNGADIDKLGKLMDLQLRWEANNARKAFVKAMNAFKADAPEIFKDRQVAYKDVAYKYATLANVCDKVTGTLSKHGISHRWRTEQSEAVIRVTCILTHELGHFEETTLSAMPDATGSKNAIQAIGSTVKYLQRYTLLAATGLEAGNEDNDGQTAQPVMEKLQEYLDSISTCPNLEALQSTFKAGWAEAVKLQNSAALKALVTAKDAKKAELLKEVAA